MDKINLLDFTQEPTDEALAALMHAVATDAQAKAMEANAALRLTLFEEVQKVGQQFHLNLLPHQARATAPLHVP